jgi:cytochrome c oxidase cbb3-type subunit II
MNRVPLILLGIFAVLAFSWTGLILSNQLSYGDLTPFVVKNDNKAYPEPLPGVAAQGKLVYQDLGCVYCHTQQVRRPGDGADDKRGWGDRQSVARDYLREERVLLGSLRAGPDLRNIGARKAQGDRTYDAAWHFKHLYNPRLTSPGSNMPAFPFLFEKHKILGEASPRAIALPAAYAPPAGYEIVPTERGEALVAYLMDLKDTFNYPEEASKVYVAPKGKEKAKEPAGEKGKK